jgi:hypothetical protein
LHQGGHLVEPELLVEPDQPEEKREKGQRGNGPEAEALRRLRFCNGRMGGFCLALGGGLFEHRGHSRAPLGGKDAHVYPSQRESEMHDQGKVPKSI